MGRIDISFEQFNLLRSALAREISVVVYILDSRVSPPIVAVAAILAPQTGGMNPIVFPNIAEDVFLTSHPTAIEVTSISA